MNGRRAANDHPRHVDPVTLARYATGAGPTATGTTTTGTTANGVRLGDPALWGVEAHLERCPSCRARLADLADPATSALVAGVRERLEPGLATPPAPPRRRWTPELRTSAWPIVAWTAVSVGMLLTAMAFELAYPGMPSLVLLIAPVAPLSSVAAAWSRRTDPAYEMVAATPGAGLWLLLRRAVIAMVVLIPILVVVGWQVGLSPARWLLPCLTFTTATLALGGRIGVDRAAAWLTCGWAAAVVAPALISQHGSVLFRPGSLPCWAVAALVSGVLMLLRADDHNRLASHG